MLNQVNAVSIHANAVALVRGDKRFVSRSYRRLLDGLNLDGKVIKLCFTNAESVLDDKAVRNFKNYLSTITDQYARRIDDDNIMEGVLTTVSKARNLAEISFPLVIDLESATLAQLRTAMDTVIEVAELFLPYAKDPAAALYSVTGVAKREVLAAKRALEAERHAAREARRQQLKASGVHPFF